MNVYDMAAEELYDAFCKNMDPQEVVNQGRTAIAAQLQTERGLKQDPAYYAADEVLTHAQFLLDLQQQE